MVATELMDRPGVDAAELAANFDDIERANRYFGGIRPVARAVFARGATSLLDVGCGSADIARALVREARARRRPLAVTALDANATILAIARARTADRDALRFVHADGGALPFADAAFDVATCNLALHHFEPAAAVDVLRELRRVARMTPVVCDLARSRAGLLAVALATRLCATNRLTRHDGPLSMRRAYTPDEARELAANAGWRRPRVSRSPFFRMVLVDGA